MTTAKSQKDNSGDQNNPPPDSDDARRDALLKRMLERPPKPHKAKDKEPSQD